MRFVASLVASVTGAVLAGRLVGGYLPGARLPADAARPGELRPVGAPRGTALGGAA
jgi:hypothetical protein